MKTLSAFYDLNHGPVSFDFATWLVRAMKERDDRRCSRLHVVVVPNEDPKALGGFARPWGKHDAAATYWRLWHIVVGIAPLARASITVCATRAQAELFRRNTVEDEYWWPEGKAHFMGPLVQAARRGEKIPRFAATDAARRHVEEWFRREHRSGRVATLTIRMQDTDPDRNCELGEWLKFGVELKARGYHVVLLDDTRNALDNGMGFFAELDPDLRLALYEQAAMNIIGNNGPGELLKFSRAPYLQMGLGLTDLWKEHFRKHFHMEPGEQLPWAAPNQRLAYVPDTIDNLRAEFERVMASVDTRQPA